MGAITMRLASSRAPTRKGVKSFACDMSCLLSVADDRIFVRNTVTQNPLL